jgi:transcriptional regulator with XRE-family HTH domain
MSYSKQLAKRRQDPEYRKAEKEVRPIFDLADDVFHLRMELARRVGTRQANISRLENGESNSTVRFLQKLGEAFGTDLIVRLRPLTCEDSGLPSGTGTCGRLHRQCDEVDFCLLPRWNR